ncbi:hypothetical protein yc1106_02709 [Curvularia clavata]|uniref:Uncharacterized protein n=1 Tax=Curvularia clavata TaxID=95742 RepID=A0A9Q8Z4B1_CURCL|nr:hypothetical protein yc1106_02709 [Curvularia clavata]
MTGSDLSSYHFTVDIGSGKFTDVVVLDNQGNTLAQVNNTLQPESEAHTVSFQLSKAANGVALWADTSDSTISLSYNVTTAPVPVSDSPGKPSSAQSSRFPTGAALLLIPGSLIVSSLTL